MNSTEAAIAELRERVKDLVEDNEDLGDPFYLLRWLKSRDMDVRKAEKMMRESIEWRKEKGLDELTTRYSHPGLLQEFPVYTTTLKNGAPVTMIRAKKIDLVGLIEKYGRNAVYEYVMQFLLQDEMKTTAWNKEVFLQKKCQELTEDSFQGSAFFIDYDGLDIRQVMSKKAVALCVQVCKNYVKYIPYLGSLYVAFNCSKLISPFVHMVKKLVQGPDLRVEVYDTSKPKWEGAILKRVDSLYVPQQFGGTFVVKGFS